MRNSISDIFGNLGDKATASARMEMISDICNNMPRELKSNARGSMIDKIRTMIRRRHDKKKLNTVKRILREPPRIYLTFPFSLPKREMPKEKVVFVDHGRKKSSIYVIASIGANKKVNNATPIVILSGIILKA